MVLSPATFLPHLLRCDDYTRMQRRHHRWKLFFLSGVGGPGFTAVPKSADDAGLVDLELCKQSYVLIGLRSL